VAIFGAFQVAAENLDADSAGQLPRPTLEQSALLFGRPVFLAGAFRSFQSLTFHLIRLSSGTWLESALAESCSSANCADSLFDFSNFLHSY